jgi:ATP-binding cassette subfamily B (MDR/TAP) protein 1
VNFYFSNFTLDHGLITPWMVGVGMFVCTFIYMYTWVYTGEAASKRIRERYLKAILRQDIAFFDKVGPGEVTTRIQTDTRTWFLLPIPHRDIDSRHCIHPDLVHQGISEKVAVAVSFFAAFFTGFVLAYSKNWRLALAMTSILPCISLSLGVTNKFVSKYMQYVYFLEAFMKCKFIQSQALT